jgi:hypothetical protein
MLTELITLTSTDSYKSNGGMWIQEIDIKPLKNPNARFTFKVIEDDLAEIPVEQNWEVTCQDLSYMQNIPLFLIPRTQIKLFNEHPLLWNLESEIYFSITTKTNDIASIMGDLFIEHTKICGNWVNFDKLYRGLPETLLTQRKNQLAVPIKLQEACFNILDKYAVGYTINGTQDNESGYQLILFSNSEIWPDDKNFSQHYIIGKEFSARRLQ